MDSLINQFRNISTSETGHKEGDVQILVYSPDGQYDILYTYYTYRTILEQSPIFREWFQKLDFYENYIEIEDGLMIFNKSDEYSYSLLINTNGDNHVFGMYNPPMIKQVIDYLEYSHIPNNPNIPNIQGSQLKEILTKLQII